MQTQSKPTTSRSPFPQVTGIYAIKTKDGEVYIGQSTSIFDRAHEHLYGREKGEGLVHGKHHNYRLQAAFDKLGARGLTLYLVQECEKGQLNNLEAYWIQKMGTLNIDRPKLKLLWWLKCRPHNQNKKLLALSELLKPGELEKLEEKNKVQSKSSLGAIGQLAILVVYGFVFGVLVHIFALPLVPTFWAGVTAGICQFFFRSK